MARIVALVLAVSLGCKSSKNENSSASGNYTIGATWALTAKDGTPTALDNYVAAAQLASSQITAALQQSGLGVTINLVLTDYGSNNANIVPQAKQIMAANNTKIFVEDSSTPTWGLLGLQYDSDPSNDINVPVISWGATSADLNNPDYKYVPIGAGDPTKDCARDTTIPELNFTCDHWTKICHDNDRWLFRTALSAAFLANVQKRVIMSHVGSSPDRNGDSIFKYVSVKAATSKALTTNFPSAELLFNNLKAAGIANASAEQVLTFKGTDTRSDIEWWDQVVIPKIFDSRNENTGQDDGPPDFIIAIESGIGKLTLQALQRYYASGNLPDVSKRPFVLYGSSALTSDVAQELGSIIDGAVAADRTNWDTSWSQDYIKDAQAAGIAKAASAANAAGAYDAVVLAALAIVQAHVKASGPDAVTGLAVRDELEHLNETDGTVVGPGVASLSTAIKEIAAGRKINYQGGSGSCDFNAYGDAPPALINEYLGQNGQWVVAKQYDCSQDSTCPPKN